MNNAFNAAKRSAHAQSGVTDLSLPFKSGSIKVTVACGVDVNAMMAKYGLSGTATLVNHPPFTQLAIAAGLDRSWRVPVPAGREKEFVALLARHSEDGEFVGMDWIDDTHLDLIPNDSLSPARNDNSTRVRTS